MTTLKVIEVLSQSDKSWEDAAQNAVNDAAKSVRGIKSIYIKELEATVENERVTQYRINAKISFMVRSPEQFSIILGIDLDGAAEAEHRFAPQVHLALAVKIDELPLQFIPLPPDAPWLPTVVEGVLVALESDGERVHETLTDRNGLYQIGNVGPGIGKVGPVDNFAWLSDGAKWLLSFLMLLGRLELFTVLILFTPYFWARG